MSAGPVWRQDGSYRKGVVLGLTMAEVMLLLMFCFLVASAAWSSGNGTNAYGRGTPRGERGRVRRERLPVPVAQGESTARRGARGGRRAFRTCGPAGDRQVLAPPRREQRRSGSTRPRRAAARPGRAGGEPPRGRREGARRVRPLQGGRRRIARGQGPEAFPEQAKVGDAAVADALAKPTRPQAKESGGGLLGFLTGRGKHDWPPIISLSEADGFHFASGRADLDLGSADRLAKSVVPRILEIAKSYDVDTIEVVGHTDEQPVYARGSSLDRGLPAVLRGTASAAGLSPADNAGLGLARAVSVVTRLTVDKRLERFAILPLSGGQLITNEQRLSVEGGGGDVQQRRRIEIRLRQSHPAAP